MDFLKGGVLAAKKNLFFNQKSPQKICDALINDAMAG
jgi:hypothetical protein